MKIAHLLPMQECGLVNVNEDTLFVEKENEGSCGVYQCGCNFVRCDHLTKFGGKSMEEEPPSSTDQLLGLVHDLNLLGSGETFRRSQAHGDLCLRVLVCLDEGLQSQNLVRFASVLKVKKESVEQPRPPPRPGQQKLGERLA